MAALIQFIQWINGNTIRIHPGDGGTEAEHAHGVLEIENGNGNQVLRRIKARYIVALIIFGFVASCVVVYVSIGGYTLDESYVDLKTTQVQRTMVRFYRNSSATPSVEAKITLRVSFKVPHEIKVYPKLGKFVFGMRSNISDTILGFSESGYIISEDDELLLLKFTVNLQEEQLRALQGKLHDHSTLWIKLRGDFEMDVKLASYPLLPKAHRHAYFLCDIAFNRVQQPNMTNFKDCMTSRQPFS